MRIKLPNGTLIFGDNYHSPVLWLIIIGLIILFSIIDWNKGSGIFTIFGGIALFYILITKLKVVWEDKHGYEHYSIWS